MKMSFPAMEKTACPYCAADRPVFWAEENGFDAQQCQICGFVYVSPRPALDAIDEAAQTGMHESERGQIDTAGLLRFRRAKVRFFRERLNELYPGGELSHHAIRWLDVGCGYGELLAAVERLTATGSYISGIDPCEPKIRVAMKRGLNVSTQSLGEIDHRFDVISLVNVFSHVPDPRHFLGDLVRLLEHDGELLLVTGNAADISPDSHPEPLFLPDHLVFAGERHVMGILNDLGFDSVIVRRYPHFFRDPVWLHIAKNTAKRVLGRPTASWRNHGPFRSLFVRARRS